MEEELKILKNEMQTVLLDIREQYLNLQNPFNSVALMEAKEQASAAIEELHLAKDQVDRAREKADIVKDKAEAAADKVEMAKNAMANMPAAVANTAADAAKRAEHAAEPANGTNSSSPTPVNQDAGMLFPSEQPSASGNYPGLAPSDGNTVGVGISNGGTSPEGQADDEDESGQDSDSEFFVQLDSGKKKPKVSKKEPATSEGGRFDLIVVAGLAQWVETAVARLGKERVEALVEVSHSMGRLPLHFKDLLIKLARLSRAENRSGMVVTARDYLMLLTQLEDLVGQTQPHDRALLSILSNDGGPSWTR